VSSTPDGVASVASVGACCDLCIADEECEAFVYDTDASDGKRTLRHNTTASSNYP